MSVDAILVMHAELAAVPLAARKVVDGAELERGVIVHMVGPGASADCRGRCIIAM
jgi:hypothetical protein